MTTETPLKTMRGSTWWLLQQTSDGSQAFVSEEARCQIKTSLLLTLNKHPSPPDHSPLQTQQPELLR